MTAQDLKNAILQLAVQGKLVPQDPNDEPASELLKRIKAEKERLIKEGKIKKEKPLAPISDNETTWDIPESWEWVKIGYLFTIVRGITFPSEAKKKTPSSGLVPCATTGSVQNQYNSDADVFVSPEYVKRDDQWLLPRDIIMSTANSRELVGKTCIWNESERKTFGGFLTVLRPANCLYPVFAYYALMSIKASGAFLKNATQTTNIANINTQVLSNTIFPLPPLPEQQRIVARIEELMPLVEEYGKAEERLTALNAEFPDKLRKSILQQAIQGKLTERDPADEPASELLKRIRAEKERLIKEGKIKKEKPLPPITEEEMPFEIPDGWIWVRFSDIATFENGDRSSRYPVEQDYVEYGIPFFGAKDMGEKYMSFANVRYISQEKYKELGNGKLQDKDFVCLLRGSVGKCAVFCSDNNHKTGFICAQMIIIRLIDKTLCDYIYDYLLSPYYTKGIESKVTGTAVKQLPGKELGQVLIPLPPLAEQKRIVDRVNELLAVCDELK